MKARSTLSAKTVDDAIKALLVLSRTSHRVLDTHAVRAAVGSHMSTSKVQVLRLLALRDAQTSSQVARFLSVSKAAVSQIIDAMKRDGLVLRKTGKDDRRETYVHLSGKGRRTFEAIRQEQRRTMRSALKHANPSTPESLIKALETMARSLAEVGHNLEGFCLQCDAHPDGTCLGDSSDMCSYLDRQRKSLAPAMAR